MLARSGVADLVFAFQCMSLGHESRWDTSLIFLKSDKPGNLRQLCPELEYVVSGWRSVIALLLKVGYLYMQIQNTTYTEIMLLLLFHTQVVWSC